MDLSPLVLIPLAATARYLEQFGLSSVIWQWQKYSTFSSLSYMRLNGTALTNLDVLTCRETGEVKGSLFWMLDHTKTAFGKRQLKKWITKPLIDARYSRERYFVQDQMNFENSD